MIKEIKNNHILLDKSSNEIWHIYIDKGTLYYDVYINNTIVGTNKIASNIKNFDAILDHNKKVHLLYLSNIGDLYHYKYDNQTWNQTLLKKSNPRTDKIDYIKIIDFKESIHIFYSFKNTRRNNDCNATKVYLMNIYGDGIGWKYKYVTILYDTNKVIQFFINNSGNHELFFFYSVNSKESFELSYSYLLNPNSIWQQGGKIYLGNNVRNIYNNCIDSRSNIHFIYKNENDIRFTYHTIKSKNDFEKGISLKNLVNCDENNKVNYNIFEFDNILYITWKTNNTLYYKFSEDYGINWSGPYEKTCKQIFQTSVVGPQYKNINFSNEIVTFASIEKENIYVFEEDNQIKGTKLKDNPSEDKQMILDNDILDSNIENNESEDLESSNKNTLYLNTYNDSNNTSLNCKQDKHLLDKIKDFFK